MELTYRTCEKELQMKTVTRRSLLSSGGALLPAVAMPIHLFAQATPSASTAPAGSDLATKQPPPFSMDLANYIADSLANGVANMHAGTAQRSDYLALSQNMHLLAKHIEQTGVDTSLKKWASIPSHADFAASQSIPAFSEEAFARVQKYAPSLTRESLSRNSCCAVPGASLSSNQLRSGINAIATQGLSYHFRSAGDMFLQHAYAMSLPDSSGPAAAILYPVYSKHAPAHMVKTCFIKPPKLTPQQVTDLCALRAGIAGGLTTVAMAWYCTLITGTVAFAWLGVGCWAMTGILAVLTALIAYYCTLGG
jgi:hypothetical protein